MFALSLCVQIRPGLIQLLSRIREEMKMHPDCRIGQHIVAKVSGSGCIKLHMGSFIDVPEFYQKAGTMIHHIPPHVIWMHIYEGREMNQTEQAHVVECSRCLEMFIICLKSESFASVLEALPEESKAV